MPEARSHDGWGQGTLRLWIAAVCCLIAGCRDAPPQRPTFLDELAEMPLADEPLPPGEPLPPLVAEGWINGPPPSLRGRVVVLEVWAYW
jgi:hypothetical protein